MIIACFDPGNHTGWVMKNTDTDKLVGGTFLEEMMYPKLCEMFAHNDIDVVVFETFNLYPGMAKHLAWNSFYPVETIGIIKYNCWLHGIDVIGQSPGIKKFAGKINPADIQMLKEGNREYTEHTKDALLHLMYFLRNNAIYSAKK